MSSIGEQALVQNLFYLSESQATAANNVANVSSNGFKRRIAMPVVVGSRFDTFLHTTVTQTMFSESIDWTVGSIISTDNPANFALRDKHLFVRVLTPSGETVYARPSTLAIDPKGRLMTRSGDLILSDTNETIDLKAAEGGSLSLQEITITANGDLEMSGKSGKTTLARLGLYHIDQLENLTAIGSGKYRYTGTKRPALTPTNDVRQRFVERSNVNTMNEMVKMITNQRGFRSTMSALTTLGKIKEAYVAGFNR